MWEAWALAALALLAWLWFDSMRAREHAVAAGARACERNGLQFLDQTVECVSVRPPRDGRGRQARARGGGRDGRTPVLVRELARRATARVLLRDASRRAAHSAAVQAASGGRDIRGAAARGVPRALGNSRRGEPLADIDG